MFNKMKSEKTKGAFENFLWGVPANDYVFQKTPYEEQIQHAAEAIQNADRIFIGAGAGFSAAAGLTYSGDRFQRNFAEFIDKYGMTDMYSAGFYPFPSEEARWGYWSKHVYVNRIVPPALPLYLYLKELVKGKEYFVLTTNTDYQFYKAGFGADHIFATQGDYGRIQCQRGCHPKTYDDVEMMTQMNAARKNCLIPSHMVPKCPVCGGPMAMNLRCDDFFVEDEEWHKAEEHFSAFVSKCTRGKTVLLELGIGFNTPVIIRFPFEKMARENENMFLIRLNLGEAVIPASLGDRTVGINADMKQSITDLLNAVKTRTKEKR